MTYTLYMTGESFSGMCWRESNFYVVPMSCSYILNSQFLNLKVLNHQRMIYDTSWAFLLFFSLSSEMREAWLETQMWELNNLLGPSPQSLSSRAWAWAMRSKSKRRETEFLENQNQNQTFASLLYHIRYVPICTYVCTNGTVTVKFWAET
jgi:hypothetical protein